MQQPLIFLLQNRGSNIVRFMLPVALMMFFQKN